MAERVLNAKVVVIGAGVAGLTAADHLIKGGITDFLILEATNRIGGRILSLPKETIDAPNIEIGAEWIHGIHGNPVFEIAKRHKLLGSEKPCKKKTPGRYKNLALMPGGSVICEHVVKEVFGKYHEAYNMVVSNENDIRAALNSPEISMGEFIKTQLDDYLNSFSPSENYVRRVVLEHRFQWETAMIGCPQLEVVSIPLFRSYVVPSGPDLPFLSGYSKLTEFMVQKLPKEKVLLQHDVRNIEYSNRKDGTKYISIGGLRLKCNCKVICGNGTTVYCDYVLLTSSLGFLKENEYDLFSPTLPEWKRHAIRCMGMGTVNKIFLEFASLDFLPKHVRTLFFIWERNGKSDTKEYMYNGPSWIKYMDNMYTFDKRYLRAWITGEGAKAMEMLSDIEVINDLWTLLKQVLKKEVPKPLKVIRSRWFNEVYYRGSYSYPHVGSSRQTVEDLATPVENPYTGMPVLFFGGEATHPDYFSTVHGAMLSGQREAKRIIQQYLESIKAN